jgi:hypothetical protein
MQESREILLVKHSLCRKSRWGLQLITNSAWHVPASCHQPLLTGISLFLYDLEWIYIKHCFCTVLTCLSFQHVKLACSYIPQKLQHWDTLRGFHWGKSQCSKKIWIRERTDDISQAPWTNKSTLHTRRESAAMIKNTVKSVSQFGTVIRADNDGPNMECSSKIAFNV